MQSPKRRVLLGHLRAVGCAAALALARVLAFAAVVARFTSALALAGVLTLATVLFLHLGICGLLIRLRGGMHAGEKVGRLDRCGAASQQTCERCASNQGLLCHFNELPPVRLDCNHTCLYYVVDGGFGLPLTVFPDWVGSTPR